MNITTILLLYVSLTGTLLASVQSCDDLKTDCEYYLCIEAEKNCGAKGYLKSFGYRYCNKFTNIQNSHFSEESKSWINKTKNCLINSIDNLDQELSCKTFKRKAFEQHKYCYVSSGFCALDNTEKRKVIRTIGFSVLKPRTLKTGLAVIKSCLRSPKI